MARRVTKEEAVRFALRWMEPLKDGQSPTPYTVLAKEFNRDRKTIAEGIQAAFEHSYLEVVKSSEGAESDPYRIRDATLESMLCNKYSVLKESIVIGTGGKRTTRPALDHSDTLHEKLGSAMGKFLVETVGFDLRRGENFGFGSGRAVYHSVKYASEFARRRNKIRVESISLVSLCGDCQVKSGEVSSPILDANYNANAMVGAIEGPFSVEPVMAESIAPSEICRFMDKSPFVKKPPNIALLGVGVLEGGHRFVKIDEIQMFVAPILNELKELNALTRQLCRPDYCPVGDICNYLFRVPAPGGLKVDKDHQCAYDRIDELIEIINKRLLVITPQELAARKTRLLLVAGGPAKAPAIRHLLSGPFGLNVKVLCTDQTTARFLNQPQTAN